MSRPPMRRTVAPPALRTALHAVRRATVIGALLPLTLTWAHTEAWAEPVTATTAATAATASPARVHVRGAARIDAHASRASGRLVLRGTLTDDSGAPLGDQPVRVSLSDGPAELGAGGVGPVSCTFAVGAAGGRPPGLPDVPDAVPLPVDGRKAIATTDAGGHFCLQASLPMGRYLAQMEWRGSAWLDATRTDVAVDLALKPVALSFAPEPTVVRVDDELSIDVIAMIDEEGAREPAAGIVITLTDERGTRLGEAATGDSGRATFAVEAARLGPPGKGELRASFDGTSRMGKTTHVAPIERRARVVLRATGPGLDGAGPTPITLPAVDADEGAPLSISVRTPRGAAVPTGSVEVLVGTLVLAAATVEAGEAHLVINVGAPAPAAPPAPAPRDQPASGSAGPAPPPSQSVVPLRVRYAPDAPWYTAGDELALALPVRAPSPWRKTPVLVAGLAVIAWLVIGRRSRTRPAAPDDAEPVKVPSLGEARIDVLRSVKTSRAGWTGRVVDAHDETAVAGAEVSLERPSFRGVVVVASAQANPAGRFELRCEDVQPGDTLAVQAPLHAMLRKAVPPFGEIQIALVLRRRKLLGRLVGWARAKGKPFDQYPEPTPGHVKRAAGTDAQTARWAEALELAAFGAEEVDDAAEKAVIDLEPRPAAAQPRADDAPRAPAGPAAPPQARRNPR
jgi:hypothetical protein